MSDRRLRRRALLIGLASLAMVWAMLPAAAGAEQSGEESIGFEEHSQVTLEIANQTTLQAVVDGGFDLDHDLEKVGDGYTVTAIVTESETAALEALGVGIELEASPAELAAQHAEQLDAMTSAIEEEEALAAELGIEEIATVVIARADTFTNTNGSRSLSVEAKNVAGTSGVTMTLRWFDDEDVQIGQTNMGGFTDAGQYMYHRQQVNNLPRYPEWVSVTSNNGGYAERDVEEWLGPIGSGPAHRYFSGFLTRYYDALGYYELIEDLAARYPDLAEIVELPYITQGYDQPAMALFGGTGSSAVGITSNMMSSEGAEDISVEFRTGEPGAPLSVEVDDKAILVRLGTAPPTQVPTLRASVDAPSSAAGAYAAVQASFGPASTQAGVNAALSVVNAGGDNPSQGCGALIGFPAGAIAVADRGGCPFVEIVGNAQAAGAAAVIVVNNVAGAPIAMGGTDASITIPSVMVSLDHGNTIKSGLPATGRVGIDLVEGPPSSNATAAQVVAAINASPAASALVHAYTYRGNAGGGNVSPAGPTQLNDYLNAEPTGPIRPKMIRIGKHRDGSKTGVFGYSAEHAREWQTPLVAVESAYRLLENYATDHKTKQLVDNMDLFILPVVNPAGEMYSKYDFASQRRNRVNHCAITGSYDLNARNSWGVDNNRNYTAYSGADGYSGASTSCTSDTYRGPFELSEPESANVHWVMAAFPNVKFSMNIHSSGNYYMWSPGSYATPGRISAPRPSFGEENFFWYMADRILTEIKQQRGLTVTPARTGPIADVLYSAAGNSGDMAWYDFGIFGFSFETGTSFQPSFASGAGSEAWQQMMEFSNGLVELFHTAMTWSRDRYAPTSWIHEDVSEPSAGPVGITFRTSEPADIYYTTDGSNPTTDSAKYDFAGIREQGETLWFEETTTIKWFSVDMAGNIEGKYDPSRNNAKTATIVISD